MAKIRLHFRVEPLRALFSEWTFDDPREVTIGRSPQSAIWLFDPLADMEERLFVRKDRELQFRIPTKLSGELFLQGQNISLPALREAGLLQRDRSGEFISMREKTSGVLTLGTTKIQFWLSVSPRDPEYPLHPVALRLLRNLSPVLTITLFLSLLVHSVILRAIRDLPPIPEPTFEDLDRSVIRFLRPEGEFYSQKRPAGEKRQRAQRAPLPRTPDAFLAAVRTSRPRQGAASSPFASLFTTDLLSSRGVERALQGKTLEAAMADALKKPHSSAFDEAPQTVKIGSIREKNIPTGSLQKEIAAPHVERFSAEPPAIREGELEADDVVAVINANAGQVRDCYERALELKPTLGGRIVVELLIGPEGKATRTSIRQSTLNDRTVEQCITSRISRWAFPRPSGGSAVVRFPFIFSSSRQG